MWWGKKNETEVISSINWFNFFISCKEFQPKKSEVLMNQLTLKLNETYSKQYWGLKIYATLSWFLNINECSIFRKVPKFTTQKALKILLRIQINSKLS